MNNINIKYNKWCEKIAKARDSPDLIAHFREHVSEHFDRHNREGETSLKVWLVGVLNFMHILEKKFPDITKEDMLFKLCTHHKNTGGAKAPFNINKFLKEYKGDIKKFYRDK